VRDLRDWMGEENVCVLDISPLHFVKKVYSGVGDGIFEISCVSFHNCPTT